MAAQEKEREREKEAKTVFGSCVQLNIKLLKEEKKRCVCVCVWIQISNYMFLVDLKIYFKKRFVYFAATALLFLYTKINIFTHDLYLSKD